MGQAAQAGHSEPIALLASALAHGLAVRALGCWPAAVVETLDTDRLVFEVRTGSARELARRVPELEVSPAGPGAERVELPGRSLVALVVLATETPEKGAADGPAAIARMLLAAARAARTPPSAPRLMGVVNTTPDSFSDGGAFADADEAVAHGLALAAEGAAILDVGGESTRPGAPPVTAREELARVVPVVRGLSESTDVAISVDTTKSAVARAALDAGAVLVNDVSGGLVDREMLPLVAERGAGFVAMHMRGTPGTMQVDPRYDDVTRDVTEALRERVSACLEAGIAAASLILDPGIGFGKTLEHNLTLLARLGELRSLGVPLLLGVSRKSFLGRLAGREDPRQREWATAAAVAACVAAGSEVLRVHDVAAMRDVVRVAHSLAVARAVPSGASAPFQD